MTVYKKIAQEQLQARKNKDTVRASLLTTVLGEFARGHTKDEPSDAQVFAALAKFEKGIKDTIALKSTPDLEIELQVVQELLALKPASVSADEVASAVAALRAENPAVNQGLVMKHLKQVFGDRLDGKTAAAQVSQILSH